MAQLKLKVKKAGGKNPVTKKMGFVARVLTNGTADFDDIVKEAGRNTTMHKAELKMAFELCMDSVTDMLKQGYWLTEYLSISRVIAATKKSYEKAYQYVEADFNDLGYFIAYNLKVLDQSFKQLQNYIKKKQEEKVLANTFLQLGDINERQAQIIRMFMENPKEVVTVKDLQNKFMVTPTTAKSDIVGLLKRGLLDEIAFNKVKRGYVKGQRYDDIVKDLEFR